ncbi:MAG TPA: glycosyltransferase [Caulobacteraceae bacterium]|nr:glycosyltransferase [Caulobacteraceae bacterium]
MTQPLVSVITPTRSRAGLLAEALDSVAAQTFADWEQIVVSDGPDDATAELMNVRTAADQRLDYVVREGEPAGANVCRNIGLKRARADLVVFLDDDDQLGPDCLAGRVGLMQRNPDVDFAVFGAGVFAQAPGDLGRRYHDLEPGDDLLRFLSLDCPWQTSGPVWRRAYLQRLGGFCERLASMQDLELHVRALCARPNYLISPAIDHYIRAHHDAARTSLRHFLDPELIRHAEAAPRMLLDEVERAGLLTWSRRRALLGLAFGSAESWARIGERREALRAWRETCRAWSVPASLALPGALALRVTGPAASQRGWAARLVNKWKGWVRFRQEPALSAGGVA